jgi:cysteine/glycine-rich protein
MAGLGGGGVACTICSKTSYPAETVQFEMKPYHAECFRCCKCNKKLEAAGASQYEGKIYCKMCFERDGLVAKQRQVKWTPKVNAGGEARPSVSKFGGGGNPCTACSKTVYSGEAVSYEQKVYHPECLKCSVADCGKKCTPSGIAHFEDKLFCTKCFEKGGYARKQLLTAKAAGDKKAASSNPRFANLGGGGNKCHKCDKTVYPAETLMFEQKPYHIKCFKCLHCSKEITVNNAEGKGDKVYCTKCFQELGLHRPTLNPAKHEDHKDEAAPAEASA